MQPLTLQSSKTLLCPESHADDLTSSSDRRIPALDGIRGLAILLVMLLHFADRSEAIGVVNRLYVQLTGVGWIGVDLFFVLSGFLITGLLLDSRGSASYFKNFYARRTLRIFPLYYACLVTWIVLVPLLHPSSPVRLEALAAMSRDQLWYWAYLSNWKIGLDNRWPSLGISVYWSLAIEEQFYLVWPAVVLLLRTGVLRRVCVGIIAAAFAIRTIQLAAGASPILVYVGTFSRMDSLAAGALASILLRDPLERARAQRLAPWLLTLGAASLVGMWIWIGVFSEYHPVMQTAGFTALALTFGSLIVQAVTPGSRVGDLLQAPVLRFFGKYSYAMYLFHETLMFEIVGHLPRQWVIPGEMGAQVTRLVVSMTATVTLAWLSWHLLEKHFLALKPRFAS